MAPPTAEVRQQTQRIREHGLAEPLDFSPALPARWFVSNVFTRCFAHLMAWTGRTTVRIAATAAGHLLAIPPSEAVTMNKTNSGNSADAWSADIDLGGTSYCVEIWTDTNDMDIARKVDGGAYNDTIVLKAGSYYCMLADSRYVRVKSHTAGFAAAYQIVSWY